MPIFIRNRINKIDLLGELLLSKHMQQELILHKQYSERDKCSANQFMKDWYLLKVEEKLSQLQYLHLMLLSLNFYIYYIKNFYKNQFSILGGGGGGRTHSQRFQRPPRYHYATPHGCPPGIRTQTTPSEGITVLETGVLPLNERAIRVKDQAGLPKSQILQYNRIEQYHCRLYCAKRLYYLR